MIRHAIAGAFAIALVPGTAAAQTTFTIEATSTDVHESPTVDARIVGHAHRGRVLEVTREDGDWLTVVWPEATTHVGYVRLTVGVLARTDGDDERTVSDVQADVDAVERAIWAIWDGRFQATTALHSEPSR